MIGTRHILGLAIDDSGVVATELRTRSGRTEICGSAEITWERELTPENAKALGHQLRDFLRSHGVQAIGHYTSGNITPLIPSFLEAGINLLGPLEVAADMDAVALRKEYGKDLLLMGNIGRAALMAGPKAVEEEFNAKVPWLMEQGGYIPAVDDMILPDISFEAMMKYVELVREFRVA